MATLKDSKYDGKGGLWRVYNNSNISAQGSIQIGGRVIALTIWTNDRSAPAPNFNVTLNEQKMTHDDVVWFRSLHPDTPPSIAECAAKPMTRSIVGRKADIVIVDDLTSSPDDDIPF